MYWIYILRCQKTGKLYTGLTEDLIRRLAEHKTNKRTYQLVFKEPWPTLHEALKREKYLKSGNGRRALKNILAGLQVRPTHDGRAGA